MTKLFIPLKEFLTRLRSIKKTDVFRILKKTGRVCGVLAVIYLVVLLYARNDANKGLNKLLEEEFVPAEKATNLIVVVHAYKQNMTNMAGVKSAIMEAR